jgi:hypothetical protein
MLYSRISRLAEASFGSIRAAVEMARSARSERPAACIIMPALNQTFGMVGKRESAFSIASSAASYSQFVKEY